jgi:hypothetical protein
MMGCPFAGRNEPPRRQDRQDGREKEKDRLRENDTAEAAPQTGNIEVDQKAELEAGDLEVMHDLGAVDLGKLFDGLSYISVLAVHPYSLDTLPHLVQAPKIRTTHRKSKPPGRNPGQEHG